MTNPLGVFFDWIIDLFIRIQDFFKRKKPECVPHAQPVEGEKKYKRSSGSALKKFLRSLWRPITTTPNYCIICGTRLHRAPGQIQYYCSKICRRMRHNSKKGGE